MTILIIIVGSVLVGVMVFVAPKLFAPKKIATLANYVKQGKATAAARLGKQILAKEPRNSEAHYLLGLSYKDDGKSDLALMELKTVNQIGRFEGYCPEVEFRKNIAKLYADFKQPEEALKEYVLLIKLEPNVADHYYETGQLFAERGNPDRALGFYRKALEIDPKHSDSHFQTGFLLYRSKHSVEAKEELEAALKYRPDNYKAYFYLGRILKENHDYVAALLAFEKAQKDQSVKTKALVERGSCYMSLNSLDKAVVELERAIRITQSESGNETLFARYFLSLCHEKMRQFDKAIEQWEKIYAKKPSFRDVAEKLSQYQDLRTDDRMKDFLTSPPDEFYDLCKSLVEGLGLTPQDVEGIHNGCQLIALEQNSKWRNARRVPTLIRIYRVSEVLDLSTVRQIHEDMKKMKVMRGMVVTSGRYSKAATDFAETRPIDLVDREKLQKLLQKQNVSETPAST